MTKPGFPDGGRGAAAIGIEGERDAAQETFLRRKRPGEREWKA